MRENILSSLNQMLSYTWLVALIGILVALFLERKILRDTLQDKSSKQPWYKRLSPLWIRLCYSAAGFAMVLLSFALTNNILGFFHDILALQAEAQIAEQSQPSAFFTWLLQDQSYIGLYGVIIFILAGYSFMLSGGTKWLKNLAGVFITGGVLLLFIGTLASIGAS